MAGIYLHIPFCRKACVYCNFHFSTSSRLVEPVVEALLLEIESRKNYLPDAPLQSVYFGGGTPSILSASHLNRIWDKLLQHFTLENGAEVTLEANPDDLTAEKVRFLRNSFVNRLSIGVQSFYDDDLRYMGRVHSAAEAESSIKRSQDAGIENISVDLIYSLPTLNSARWKTNLNFILDLDVPHLAAYQLTVEPRTALAAFIAKGTAKGPADEAAAEQFNILADWAAANGYDHYEISNLAKPGSRAVHNSGYWRGEPYLGIGPSAHSFNGENLRSWNIANNALYIKAIQNGDATQETETLTPSDIFNEHIMTRLRLIEGVSLSKLESLGEGFREHFLECADPYIQIGALMLDNDNCTIAPGSRLFADRIASDCFHVK